MDDTLDLLQDSIELLINLRDWMYVVPKANLRGFSIDKEYWFNYEDFKMFRTPEDVGIAVKSDTGEFELFSYSEFLSFFDRK
ncbi:TPA: hypothetical protein ACR3Z0_005493 [Bacillus thuringiensis]|uniref:Uncharacterized protein n=5 Tax=Bacillus cereus group TaxID=86661 RepID=A0A9X6Q1J5_BACTU|nr:MULTISPECIES: hypothetical protein [Bacillus cereus group]AEA19428.1 hypothetical protein CT43_P281085 [Bacillus thuringiensis serovar chinensis CT-43]AGG05129.1 hypothetical protein H175_285p091 [Bacillus thuringiensis serovar thuringiensis str. IS5056]AHZ54808.1 hypothetical protein YBT1520_31551 [Bacillus thuringiensis serovar kurstaki str. YBT-1520]AIE37258.1 hypothetical protein BTK_31526 [Bacillus thuringiensis serovar kurstaki str. HD-1]AIM34540.1 hypothetical protein DF16_pBMB293orf